ncbi:polyprotein, partial [Chinese artichoke mosaic virus]
STVVDNTLMVILAMKYSLKRLGIPYKDQDKYCKFVVNGDDLIIALHPTKEKVLDGMSQEFADLGLNYDFSSRTRDVKDLWFMSHCGIDKGGLYIPKLEPERVVSILEWDRAGEPEHRLEAICASMIEAWGYDDLLHEIRKFYKWVLEQAPYNMLASEGKAPYIAEVALQHLYTGTDVTTNELLDYYRQLLLDHEDEDSEVYHQADETIDAGKEEEKKPKSSGSKQPEVVESGSTKQNKAGSSQGPETQQGGAERDRDIDAGTNGTIVIPRVQAITKKMRLPKVKGKVVLNIQHLIDYSPDQDDLFNTRSSQEQFSYWYDNVKASYDLDDASMQVIMNGLMVWCLNNSTSPNLKGNWVMMDGDEQVEYPLQPILEYAQPTFRMIMRHFSDAAEAYIVKENTKKPYMPRYGLIRNLRDYSCARYAFDFYEMNSKTPVRAKEAHLQMKAAALRGAANEMFGLDGKVGETEERTERHTAADVNKNMHSLLGVRHG